MKYFGPTKKKVQWIQFCSSVCSSVTLSKSSGDFFHFRAPHGRCLANSVPFVCTLVHSFVIDNQNNLKIFLIFCKKGTVWKEGTFFEENNVPLSNVGQIGAQNPKTILMIFVILYKMMEGNSVQFQPLSNKIFVFNKFWEMSSKKLESLHQFKTYNNIENY